MNGKKEKSNRERSKVRKRNNILKERKTESPIIVYYTVLLAQKRFYTTLRSIRI